MRTRKYNVSGEDVTGRPSYESIPKAMQKPPLKERGYKFIIF